MICMKKLRFSSSPRAKVRAHIEHSSASSNYIRKHNFVNLFYIIMKIVKLKTGEIRYQY